ncbi:anion exchange protein-like protein 1 [Sarcoptes scabiei]|uniref:Anion exchange protein-like protein 1 n=1 Tax=Sarcoptes scabiei TaxID=52283 RepID=A0A131ZYB9_SARSC|nr:anion exchange protein-like protein 1 [Sarcoptes scabiei]
MSKRRSSQTLSVSSPGFIPIDMETSSETTSSVTSSCVGGAIGPAGQVTANTASSTLCSIPSNPFQALKQHDAGDFRWSDEANQYIGRFTIRKFNQDDPTESSVYSATINGGGDTIRSHLQSQDESDDDSDINEELGFEVEEDLNANNIVSHVEILISRLRNEVVRMKNFNNEVRAGRDVKSFLNNPCVLLDVNGDSVEEIIDQMLMAINKDLTGTLLADARSSLYDTKNAFQLSDFLQGIYHTETGEYLHDPTWICTFASINNLHSRRIVMARLQRPSNFGPTLNQVQLIVLALVPSKEKTSKSAFEIARTFASLFLDSSLRMSLLTANSEAEFCSCIAERVAYLKRRHSSRVKFKSFSLDKLENDYTPKPESQPFVFGKGLVDDFKRRIKFYPSDFIDGLTGKNTIPKVSAAVLSIFFACLLPPIAFGVVNEHNTKGLIGPKEGLISQAIGGLIFALFSGQPLVIIATTAPLTLYVSIVHQASLDWQVHFLDLFAAVGCFCAFYLISYAFLNVSNLIKHVTRSTEEIFATFVFVAFTAAAFGECFESFRKHYCFEGPNLNQKNFSAFLNDENSVLRDCLPAKSILFLFLMLGTVAMAVLLYNFSSTPFLSSILRGTLADYALPLSVITFSFLGSAVFHDVHGEFNL